MTKTFLPRGIARKFLWLIAIVQVVKWSHFDLDLLQPNYCSKAWHRESWITHYIYAENLNSLKSQIVYIFSFYTCHCQWLSFVVLKYSWIKTELSWLPKRTRYIVYLIVFRERSLSEGRKKFESRKSNNTSMNFIDLTSHLQTNTKLIFIEEKSASRFPSKLITENRSL